MTAQPGAKRSIKQVVGEQLNSVIFQPGWPRWVLLAVAALVFILAALALTGGSDYRDDPAALAPRSSQVYMETRDLDSLLRTVAAWKLWRPERRSKGDEQRNQLQVDLAGLIGEQVAGLGTRLPLLWLVETKQAAYCVNQDEQGNESWALFLRIANSAGVMSDIGVEQGMTVEKIKGTDEQGVFKLTGTGAGELYFGVVSPWLVISSQPTLPEFALDSSRRPAFSLARSGLLPNWRHGAVMRGIANPVYQAGQNTSSAYGILSKWMDPDVRVNFSSKIGRKGLETTFDADQLSERVRGGGLWPLFAILLAILGLIALAIVFAIILAMVGWGGWLKSAAMRAGITPAKGPAAVKPSSAFMEDSGAAKAAATSPRPATTMATDSPESANKTKGQDSHVAATSDQASGSVEVAAKGEETPSSATNGVKSDASEGSETAGSPEAESQKDETATDDDTSDSIK